MIDNRWDFVYNVFADDNGMIVDRPPLSTRDHQQITISVDGGGLFSSQRDNGNSHR